MNLKFLAAALLAAAAFFSGYQYAAALYGKDIAKLREDYAVRAAALEEKYRGIESEKAKALAVAWEERDRARADAVDLSADLERVRVQYGALKRRMSAADANPAKPNREPGGGGEDLVARCSKVVARCVGLAQELSADRDAVNALISYPYKGSPPTPGGVSGAYPEDRHAGTP